MRIILNLVMVLLALSSDCLQATELDILTVSADTIDIDQKANSLQASGKVKVKYKNFTLWAEELQGSLSTLQVRAKGDVRLAYGEKEPYPPTELSGDHLNFNFKSRTGSMLQIKARAKNIFIRGEKLEILPDRLIARNCALTTCDLPEPHYKFAASEVMVKPNDKLVTRSASFWIGRQPVFTLPYFSSSLKAGAERASPLPKLGYSATEGLLVKSSYQFTPSQLLSSSQFDLLYSIKRHWHGGILLESPAIKGGILAAFLTLKEELPGRLYPNLIIDRLPEVVYKMDGMSLRLADTSCILEAQGSLGRFYESPTGVRGSRKNLQLALKLPTFEREGLLVESTLSLRQSWYDTGDTYRVLGTTIKLGLRRHEGFKMNLIYDSSGLQGSTPFKFDTVEISRQAIGTLGFQWSRGWGLDLFGRYDLSKKDFPDYGWKITKGMHCYDFLISWSKLRGEWGVSLRLPE